MPLRHALVLAVLVLAPAPASAASDPVAPREDAVDTTALRYYASRHETARAEAELRRLRTLHPGWQPPTDPAAPDAAGAPSDEQALWDLFGADKLDDLASELARRRAADPTWEPPAGLADKLNLKLARRDLIAASDRKDYAAVLGVTVKTPAVVDAADLDVAWRVADAHARTGKTGESLAIDRAILGNNQDPAVRLATLRMALASLPAAEVKTLMSLGKTGPDGRSEFDPVALDLVRQHVGTLLQSSTPGDLPAEDLDRLAASARLPDHAGDAALLGWLNLKRKDWKAANEWFRVALAVSPAPGGAKPEDARVAQGAVQALRELGRSVDAENLAYAWRDADPAMMLVYLDAVEPDLTRPQPIPIDTGRLKRFSDVVSAQQSGDGAQALGWYAYNVGQWATARAWFERALAWRPRETTALGLGLSLQRLGDRAALDGFVSRNIAAFPALASLGKPERGQSGPTVSDAPPRRRRMTANHPKHAGSGETQAASRGERSSCPSRPAAGSSRGSGSLQMGWCLMSLDRPQEAALAFAAARNGSDQQEGDAAYGEALAQLRNKRAEAAVAAAASAPLSGQRRSEIGLAALSQSATTAFDEGRYAATLDALDRRRVFAPEPRGLAILRAWSLFHTDRSEDAQRQFELLDRQLSTPESRSGLATVTHDRRL